MEELLLVILIFGKVVMQWGPYPAATCTSYQARAIAEIDRRAASGVPYHHDGRLVTRADVTARCRPK